MTALHTIVAAIVVISVGTARDARGQHEGHQKTGSAAPLPRNPSCADGVQKALAIVEEAATRLDVTQRTTSTDMRAEMAEVQRTVAAAQAELFTCRAAVPAAPVAATPVGGMAGMDHSKIDMGKPAPAAKSAKPGAKAADPMAGMDHSKMDMGKPAPVAKSAKPGAKAADPMGKPATVAKSAKPGAKAADPMAGMDHSKMNTGGGTAKPGAGAIPAGSEGKLPVAMAERIADPACPDNVGKATAAKAVHERKVYYFCSTGARDEFRKDPVGYLQKHPR